MRFSVAQLLPQFLSLSLLIRRAGNFPALRVQAHRPKQLIPLGDIFRRRVTLTAPYPCAIPACRVEHIQLSVHAGLQPFIHAKPIITLLQCEKYDERVTPTP